MGLSLGFFGGFTHVGVGVWTDLLPGGLDQITTNERHCGEGGFHIIFPGRRPSWVTWIQERFPLGCVDKHGHVWVL